MIRSVVATTFLALSLAASPLHGAGSDPVAALHEAFAALEQEQAELGERYANATDEQWRDALRDWHEETEPRREALVQQAMTLNPPAPISDEPIIVELPAKASAKERKLITEQVALDNELDEVSIQHADPEKRRDAIRNWHERNAKRFAAQENLGKEVQALQPVVAPRQIPPPVEVIPTNASPRLRAFLQKEASLANEEQTVRDQFSTASAEAQRDAIRNFHERTATRRNAQTLDAGALSAQ